MPGCMARGTHVVTRGEERAMHTSRKPLYTTSREALITSALKVGKSGSSNVSRPVKCSTTNNGHIQNKVCTPM